MTSRAGGNNPPLRIQVSSDADEESLVAEIISRGNTGLILTRNVSNEFFLQWPEHGCDAAFTDKIPLTRLLELIEEAKMRIG